MDSPDTRTRTVWRPFDSPGDGGLQSESWAARELTSMVLEEVPIAVEQAERHVGAIEGRVNMEGLQGALRRSLRRSSSLGGHAALPIAARGEVGMPQGIAGHFEHGAEVFGGGKEAPRREVVNSKR
jgi:hypothetical protein